MREIRLSARGSGRNKGVYVAIVDEEFYDLLSQTPWSAYVVNRGKGLTQVYAGRRLATGKRPVVFMHRAVWEAAHGPIPQGLTVDHIEHGAHAGLDNRRANLRLATRTEQQGNRRKSPATSSSFKGVCWDRSRGKWLAYIYVDDVRRYIGRYHTEIEAAGAYDQAARQHFGEFARVNSHA